MGKLTLKRIALSLGYIVFTISLSVGFVLLLDLSPWSWFSLILLVPLLFISSTFFFYEIDELENEGREEKVPSKKEPKEIEYTSRGFPLTVFVDRYGQKCRLQQSSANLDDIWIFVDEPREEFEHSILLTRDNIKQINDFKDFLDKDE